MKLLAKGLVILAAAVAVVLVSSVLEHARSSTASDVVDMRRTGQSESAAHDNWELQAPMGAFVPPNASWVAIFGADWR